MQHEKRSVVVKVGEVCIVTFAMVKPTHESKFLEPGPLVTKVSQYALQGEIRQLAKLANTD